MSNNLGPHSTQGNRLPFIAARYLDRTATIRRTRDYEEAVASTKAAFPSLKSMSIKIIATVPEIKNGGHITEAMWAELSPNLVEVSIVEAGGCSAHIPADTPST
ncbi:hypothetical protein FRC10_001370 [Ceratobasidium sp. 414]|nr:hypothetical protein FRC10_001370 [Ceratobasidium sp. 414]